MITIKTKRIRKAANGSVEEDFVYHNENGVRIYNPTVEDLRKPADYTEESSTRLMQFDPNKGVREMTEGAWGDWKDSSLLLICPNCNVQFLNVCPTCDEKEILERYGSVSSRH